MSDILEFSVENGIARLTLNRPDMGNAIDLPMARALVDAAMRCDQDDAIRVVVLTGAGRMFCAGGDIAAMQGAGDNVGAAISELAGTLHMAVARLARMRKPLICLINGPAAGAGLSLAMLGDIVLAANASHFTVAYGAIGLTPDGGCSWLLPRLVGLRAAQELILTNRRVPAEEAARFGLVTRCVADEELASEGEAMAALLHRSATAAIGTARALLLDSYGTTLETHLELEARGIAAASKGAEGREGVAAFSARRKPEFV